MDEPRPDQNALDDELARRARERDPVALASLYRGHGGDLLRHLERTLGDRAEAEDVLQETFLRIFEGRGRYEPRGRFRSWLFTIATRLAHDRLRQRKRRGQLDEQIAPADAVQETEDPFEVARRRHTLTVIESALEDLPGAYQATFALRIREDFSYREIANVTGESEGTLRSRVHHTLRRLRAALAASRDETTDTPADAATRSVPAPEEGS